MTFKPTTYLIAFIFLCHSISWAQQAASKKLTNQQIESLIESYKNDMRGPYYRIKWFCDDDTIREAKDPCPDSIGGGIQHASFKESALKLRKTNHIFFADILATLKPNDFLDTEHNHSRLKQYQIGKYLESVDDGWVLRQGQYYRGSVQSEDEQEWGKEFFEKILKNDDLLYKKYYLIRQALKDIPHNGDSNIAQLMRTQSKTLSEDYSAFMDLRIKIHGKPEASDIGLVKAFDKKHESKLSDELKRNISNLIQTMEAYYAPINFKELEADLKKLNPANSATKDILTHAESIKNADSPQSIILNAAKALSAIRQNILSYSKSSERLLLLDVSNELEHALIAQVQDWKAPTIYENLEKVNTLVCAAMGTGLLEEWEYQTLETQIGIALMAGTIELQDLIQVLTVSRSAVEWSAAMVKANYQNDVDNYTAFESLSYGFIDDRVRSSVALSLGETVGELSGFVAKASQVTNQVMSINNQGAVRGLNPGYTRGELVIVDGNPDAIEVRTDKIYVFEKPPADLKPVAGIMTVSEGNLVSHVQLLARNLGIPNAALSYDNLQDLKKYHGQTIFYAVSNKGNVIVKLESDMTKVEQGLFNKEQRSKNIITVPVDNIRLDKTKVVNMRDVDANDSGKLCGPKAANLGELKKLFPEKVVEGLIIPFGVFREHMDQLMPNENKSYWNYLNDTFARANKLKAEGIDTDAIEHFQLLALSKLHDAIIKIPLEKSFLANIKSEFKSIFGSNMGQIPVFLRSDTNMEDLKEFTGAGLNLTLFNILDEDEILNGIKRVWASAYTERSFKWRQSYLSNPENVFPSILIIPSVDVDYSGVMITKGINSGNENDLTVAFSRGAGGAVDGQSAETRLVTASNNALLAPARQADYIRLPETGGTKRYVSTFESPILNNQNIEDIRLLAQEIRKNIPHNGDETQAYDVEFGFKDDELWLFQIRPFVENKQAKSSEYLTSIAPQTPENLKIKLSTRI